VLENPRFERCERPDVGLFRLSADKGVKKKSAGPALSA
jgi:hypothetical protein